MTDKTIALVVAGSGETDPKEVADLLEDAYADYADLGVIVPVDKDLYTNTVANVVEWYGDDASVYPINTKGAPLSRASSKLGDEDSTQVVDHFDEVFEDSFEGFDEVVFLTALPDEDDPKFDFYVGIIETAIDSGFVVKDLSAGLDDIKLADEEAESDVDPTEEESTPEPEPEPEAKPKRKRRTKAQIEADKAAAEAEKAEEPEKEDPKQAVPVSGVPKDVQAALSIVGEIADFFETVDVSNAQINRSEVKYRPLTEAAREAYISLMSYLIGTGTPTETPEAAEEPVVAPEKDEEPPKRGRGRPRTNTPQEKQIWDEDTDEWIARPRGRQPKGTKTRTINPETNEVLEEGEV